MLLFGGEVVIYGGYLRECFGFRDVDWISVAFEVEEEAMAWVGLISFAVAEGRRGGIELILLS